MSAPHFLVPALPDRDTYTLAGPEGHHAADVQRLRAGEELVLADGVGGTAHAVVTAAAKGRLDVRITARASCAPPDPRIVVVQAIAKGDRGELAVQAMTEVGVDAIVPWSASRSVVQWRDERGERARQRWVDTAREAAKQARRGWVPGIEPAQSTRDLLGRLSHGLILHAEGTNPLSTVELPDAGDVIVVVGPEGGIAPDELAAFTAAGARVVRLGPTVLRTSTAGVAAVSVLSARLGRW